MSSITIDKLSKVYDNDVIALQDITLEISSCDFLVIIGPSGCGKTTLLMLIAGLEQCTSGKIFIDGICVNEVEPKNRDIAMVFQSHTLYPMTVLKNLTFPLKIKHVKKDVIKQKIEYITKLLNIEDLLKRNPNQLSGGQCQRVAIGKAIMREPKVFLMDEPLSNLDLLSRNKLREELKTLHKQLKTTIVFVTHDQVEAMTLATKLVVMNKGKIEQVGTPYDIFTN